MSEIHPDPNLRVEAAISEPDVRLYDVRRPPFALYGFFRPLDEPVFKRLPDEVARAVSPDVAYLCLDTAGGRVRFSTDSDYIAIRAEMPAVTSFSHMPLTGTSGFDLYLDDPASGASRYVKTFVPPTGMTQGYESVVCFPGRRTRYFTIHFPLYNHVNNLFVGLREDAAVGPGLTYRSERPVVYYGSSITQGGCASRPGNAYQNILSRELGLDHLNLGFSGSAKGEEAMADYLASLDMCAFVCDYDHNTPSAAHLAATLPPLYEKIRARHPDLPILLVSAPDVLLKGGDDPQWNDRLRIIRETCEKGVAKGDRNVRFLPGSDLFAGDGWDACTVDGTHPNDLGFYRMAKAIGKALRSLLG